MIVKVVVTGVRYWLTVGQSKLKLQMPAPKPISFKVLIILPPLNRERLEIGD
jgi:hypothetical protein